MIRLTTEQEAQIRRQGEAEYPLECCGVLLGVIEAGVTLVQEVRPLRNANQANPERRFSVEPDAMRDLLTEERRTGRFILGFYHSHPDCAALPSETDQENAWEGWLTLILSVQNGRAAELTAWNFDAEQGFARAETEGLRTEG